mmetsp:Transcript_9316/g.19256  ORF Transcript_9316/g.19256 Transcript_9316/m.19256 type:complete len:180 (+) Transcript_9316:1-540(+)
MGSTCPCCKDLCDLDQQVPSLMCADGWLTRGARVMALGNDGRHYAGTIVDLRSTGAASVFLDDGSFWMVPSQQVCLLAAPAPTWPQQSPSVSMDVPYCAQAQCFYSGTSPWGYRGTYSSGPPCSPSPEEGSCGSTNMTGPAAVGACAGVAAEFVGSSTRSDSDSSALPDSEGGSSAADD